MSVPVCLYINAPSLPDTLAARLPPTYALLIEDFLDKLISVHFAL
jgi:hypothetical protein